jgi:ribulose-phosphate 3-epimerase
VVDGGIDRVTAPLAVRAGADVLVAGSAIFGSADPAAAYRALADLARQAAREMEVAEGA